MEEYKLFHDYRENDLIKVLGTRSAENLKKIQERYNGKNETPLKEALQKKLDQHETNFFIDAILSLFDEKAERDARFAFRKTTKNTNCEDLVNTEVLILFLCTCQKKQHEDFLQKIQKIYSPRSTWKNKNLLKKMLDATRRHYDNSINDLKTEEMVKQLEKAFKSTIAGDSPEEDGFSSHEKKQEDDLGLTKAPNQHQSKQKKGKLNRGLSSTKKATKLATENQGEKTEQESVLVNFLTTENFLQLKAVFDGYKKQTGKEISESVEQESGIPGLEKHILKHIVNCIQDPIQYIVDNLDVPSVMVYTIVSRCKDGLKPIKDRLNPKTTLALRIKERFYFDENVCQLLLELSGETDQNNIR